MTHDVIARVPFMCFLYIKLISLIRINTTIRPIHSCQANRLTRMGVLTHSCNAQLLNTLLLKSALQALLDMLSSVYSCIFSFSGTKLRIIFITLQCFG